MTAKTTNSLTTHIEMKNNNFQISEPIPINFIVQNSTENEIEFCFWQTPLEKELTANCFEIIHEGEVLDYNGKMVKRKPPTKEDYLLLKPNQTANKEINLNNLYHMTRKGTYTMRFLGRSINGLSDSEPIYFTVNN